MESLRNAEISPVVRAIRILAAVSREEEPVSLAALSQIVRLPKPTVHRLAALLEQQGLLDKDPLTRRYVVARGFHDLALSALRAAPVHRSRQLILQRLSERLGETVNLGILHGATVTYLERVEAAWPLRMDFKPGSRVPVHCTAIGKLLLAFTPPRLRDRLLTGTPLQRYTKNTITTAEQLLEELRATRERGHSEDNEEFLAGVCCLAVPVRNGAGDVIAGLAVSAPSARFPLDRARSHLPDLREFADLLGAHLEATRPGRT
jgi:IclR family transcriptional regulator, acetate operon repressor